MKYVLKGTPFRLIYVPVVSVLYAALMAGLLLFLASLLERSEFTFYSLWATLYVWIVGISIGYEIVLKIIARLVFGLYYSRKFKCTFEQVLEARLKYDIFKNKNFGTWTPEEFTRQYESAKSREIVVGSLTKMFYS